MGPDAGQHPWTGNLHPEEKQKANNFWWVHGAHEGILIPLHAPFRLASLRKTLHGILKPRVLFFRRVEGMELQLVVGHRLIGRRLPGKEHWEIKRPFRLFVDEALLPRPTPPEATVPRGW
jgi:hypothetical protein